MQDSQQHNDKKSSFYSDEAQIRRLMLFDDILEINLLISSLQPMLWVLIRITDIGFYEEMTKKYFNHHQIRTLSVLLSNFKVHTLMYMYYNTLRKCF